MVSGAPARFVWLLLAVTVGACSDNGPASVDTVDPSTTDAPLASPATPSTTSASHFMVLQDGGWTLRQAVKPAGVTGAQAGIEPSLDWWSEYERAVAADGGAIEASGVRISGHRLALQDHGGELPGFQGSDGEIDGRPARIGTGPDGPPAVITMAVEDDYTVMVLSYELSVDELTEVAEQLEIVSESDWLAAGGEIRDCEPGDPTCRSPE